ncbi:unnamed protein product [Closterium sp. Naga37s-1]|nr:unnamed protein product [Closterium sp. Naga37s-1]
MFQQPWLKYDFTVLCLNSTDYVVEQSLESRTVPRTPPVRRMFLHTPPSSHSHHIPHQEASCPSEYLPPNVLPPNSDSPSPFPPENPKHQDNPPIYAPSSLSPPPIPPGGNGTTEPTNPPSLGTSASGLSTGAIVGIVVGVILAVVGAVAVAFIVIQCCKQTEAIEVEYPSTAVAAASEYLVMGAYTAEDQYYKPSQEANAAYQPGAAAKV